MLVLVAKYCTHVLHVAASFFGRLGATSVASILIGAPLMAILLIFEMTLSYEVVLPLMLACVTAYYASHRIEPRSVYARALERRRGTGAPARTATQLHVLARHPGTGRRRAPHVSSTMPR